MKKIAVHLVSNFNHVHLFVLVSNVTQGIPFKVYISILKSGIVHFAILAIESDYQRRTCIGE